MGGGKKVPFVPHPQKHGGGDMTPCPPPKQGPWPNGNQPIGTQMLLILGLAFSEL